MSGVFGTNWLDLSSTSNRYIQTYYKGFVDISGGPLYVRNNNLFVQGGDIILNGRLFTGGDVSLNSRLYAGSDVSFGGKLFTAGDISNNARLYVGSDASFGSRLFVAGDVSLNGNVFVTTQPTSDNSTKVATTAYVKTALSAVTGAAASFTGDVSINNRLFIGGDASFGSRLFTVGDVSFNQRLYVGSDVSFGSRLYIANDISMAGNIYSQYIVSLPATIYQPTLASFGQPFTLAYTLTGNTLGSIAISSTGQYAILAGYFVNYGVYYSSNYGQTWTAASANTLNFGSQRASLSMSGTGQYAVASGINNTAKYYSSNYGQTWTQSATQTGDSNISVSSAAISMSYTGQYVVYGSVFSRGIVYSSDYGQTYSQSNLSTGNYVVAISGVGSYAVASGTGGSYYSTNYGQTWSSATTVVTFNRITMSYSGKYVVGAESSNFVWYSSDYGNNYTKSVNSIPSSSYGGTITISTTGQYVFANGDQIYYSTNYGQTWNTSSSTSGFPWVGIAMSGNAQYVLSLHLSGGIYSLVNPGIAATNASTTIYTNLVGTVDVSINNRLFVGSDTSMNGNLSIANDLTIGGNLYVKTYNSRNMITELSYQLIIAEDISVNGRLFLSNDASINNRLFIGADASFGSRLFTVGDVSFNSRLYVGGDVSMQGRLFMVGDVSLNSRLYVGSDASINGSLFINSRTIQNGDISANNRFFVGADASLGSRLFVSNDVSFNQRLYVGSDVSLGGNLTVNLGTTRVQALTSTTGTFSGLISATGPTGQYISPNSSSLWQNASDAGATNVTTWTTSGINWTVSANSIMQNRFYPILAFNGVTPVSEACWISDAALNAYSGTNGAFTGTAVITAVVGQGNIGGTWLVLQADKGLVMNNYNVGINFAGVRSWMIAGSNDGTTWYPIHSFLGPATGPVNSAAANFFNVTYSGSINGGTATSYSYNSNSFTQFRFICTASYYAAYAGVGEWTINFNSLTNISLTALNDVSFGGNFYLGKDISLNGNLSLNGLLASSNDLSLNSRIFLAKDASFNSRLFVGSDTSLNSNVYVGKDLTVNGNFYVQAYTTRQMITELSYQLIIAEDISVNGRLFLSNDASINNRLFIGGDASFGSRLFTVGDVSFNSRLYVGGDVSMQGRLFMVGDVSLNSRLFVGSDASINGSLFVNSRTINNGDISANNRLFVGADASFSSRLFTVGDVSFNNRLYVGSDASFGGNFYVGKNVGIAKAPTYPLDISGISRTSGGVILGTLPTTKYYNFAGTPSTATITSPILTFTFGSSSFYAKFHCFLSDASTNTVSSVIFDVQGGNAAGSAPSNNIAEITRVSTINGYYQWLAPTYTTTTVVLGTTANTGVVANYSVRVELIQTNAVLANVPTLNSITMVNNNSGGTVVTSYSY